IELQSPEVDAPSADELECKICYSAYNLAARRPKVLGCCHRLCAKCLAKILDLGESPPDAVACPFCRYVTGLPGQAVSGLPDDCNLAAALALQSRNQRNLHSRQEATTELLLSPGLLSSLMGGGPPTTGSPNFVVITIMETPPPPMPLPASGEDLRRQPRGPRGGFRSSSLDSTASIAHRWTAWNCASQLCQTSARVLVWVLGLLYFSSLPMGVYLLIMQRTTVGLLLVSLVPASLVVIMVYGFCQCVYHELWDCVPP
uniref:E3 ubiquitin-protein ligase RNF182 n=1 Tax=Gasterosteus aculeatus TaxID=69293 RepID=G3Q1M7_GASAC